MLSEKDKPWHLHPMNTSLKCLFEPFPKYDTALGRQPINTNTPAHVLSGYPGQAPHQQHLTPPSELWNRVHNPTFFSRTFHCQNSQFSRTFFKYISKKTYFKSFHVIIIIGILQKKQRELLYSSRCPKNLGLLRALWNTSGRMPKHGFCGSSALNRIGRTNKANFQRSCVGGGGGWTK